MSDDTPPPTALAAEIYRNFERKMAHGGEIDRILNGGEPIEKRAPESDAEIELRKRQIGVQFNEYQLAITAAEKWWQEWKQRQQRRGFRCVERET